MINKKRLLENLHKAHPQKTLVEYNFSQLATSSDAARKSRANMISGVKYEGIGQGPDGQARTYWTVPSQTDRGTKYNSIVEIVVPVAGGLFGLAHGKWDMKKYTQALKNSDVKVHCSCPDFHWSGMAYNLGPNGKYKNSNVNASNSITPPNIRDPERQHVMCKHLIAVFKVFPFNANSIFSQARKFNVEIETNPALTNEMDKGLQPLAKDIEMVEIPQEQKNIITDSIGLAAADALAKNETPEIAEEIIQDENEVAIDIETEIPEEKEIGSQEIITTASAETPIQQQEQQVRDQQSQSLIDEKNQTVEQVEPQNGEEQPPEVIRPEPAEVLEKDKPKDQSIATQSPSQILGR